MNDVETPGRQQRHDLGTESALGTENTFARRPLNTQYPNPVHTSDGPSR
jgi:hypothetical protein